jgi:hypothetical protein
MQPVSPDNPTCFDSKPPADNILSLDPPGRRSPKQIHPDLFCSHRQQLLECGSPDAPTFTGRECCGYSAPLVAELDAAEGCSLVRADRYAQAFESLGRIGHQSFAAGLIDRGLSPIENRSPESSFDCLDRSGQTGRPATHNRYIILRRHLSRPSPLQQN